MLGMEIQECMEEDQCGDNKGVWQEMVEEWSLNKRQRRVNPSMRNTQMAVWERGEINGQMILA